MNRKSITQKYLSFLKNMKETGDDWKVIKDFYNFKIGDKE